MRKYFNIYTFALLLFGMIAMVLLLCQPVEGLNDWEFLAVLAVTKSVGAFLAWLLVRLALRWEREGKITLSDLSHDTCIE